jgi:hypothetical protein
VGNVFSDKIPVSDCALDSDNDGINNNVDIDNDMMDYKLKLSLMAILESTPQI